MRNKEVGSLPYITHKNELHVDRRANVRAKVIQLLEENIDVCDPGLLKTFLDMTRKGQVQNKFDCIKMKTKHLLCFKGH